MAGIGFELRKILKRESFVSLIQAYGAAGVISSGPWIISILSIFAIGVMTIQGTVSSAFVSGFQVSVTYLMATSLILTGPLQLSLTRFVSDRHYEKRYTLILPNVFGAITLVTVVSGTLAAAVLTCCFSGSVLYRLLMLAGFVMLSNIWIVVLLLSAIKAWKPILIAFFSAYTITVGAATLLHASGTEGLLAGFVAGHSVLLFVLLSLVARKYPATQLITFDFLRRGQVFISLAITGLVYNLAIWVDKFMFWFNPLTGETILEPLHYSPIYDLPIFLAYLSIVPGMAVLLLRMETDFAEHYERFYHTIRQGGTLDEIIRVKNDMISAIRRGLYEIFKVQGMTVVILIVMGPKLLAWAGIPPLYRLLLNVDLVAVGVQMLLLAILNVLFYFDQRRIALGLTVFFAVTNIGFTALTLYLGPAFYGYGFAGAVVFTSIIGLILLSRTLERLEYETFMLQRVVF
jgi:polysaccharide biosynthesis protein PelG